MERASREGRAAPPPAHHLRGQQLLVLGALAFVAEVSAKRSDALVELAEDGVRAVPSEDVGLRRGWKAAHLVPVAEDELPCLERRLERVGAGDAAALDCRMADSVPEAERLPAVGAAWQSCCQIAAIPESSRYVFRARFQRFFEPLASGATAVTTTCTSSVPSGGSQCSGLLSPVSPSVLGRAAIPCWNSHAKLSSESRGTPSAFRP